MEPRKILLIGPLPGPIGGVGVSFQQLVRELGERDDMAVEVVDTFRGEGGIGLGDLGLALRIAWWALVRGRRFDVISFQASSRATVLFGPLILGICRLLGRPFLLREFGGSFDEDLAAMHPLARRLGLLCLGADLVLLQTRALVAHFRAERPEARIRWFPTSRPLAATPQARSGCGPARRFVFASHVKATKGIPEILEASRALPEGCSIDVFGPFRDGMSEAVFAGQERVRYGGILPSDQVQATLRDYDALLLPTHHFGEGYPGIILEAYSVGLPVVTTRFRAIPEIVEDGVSGLLIEPRDAAALAGAMQRLAGDEALLDRLRRGAVAASQRFRSTTWTACFAAHCHALAEGREPPEGPPEAD